MAVMTQFTFHFHLCKKILDSLTPPSPSRSHIPSYSDCIVPRCILFTRELQTQRERRLGEKTLEGIEEEGEGKEH